MRQARFDRLLLEHGADLGRWPEDERGAARALLAASAGCRRRREQARRLEELVALDRARLDERCEAPERASAIAAAALRRVRTGPERAWDWRWLLSRPAGAALAAAVLAGAIVGWVAGPTLHPPRSEAAPAIEALLEDGPLDAEDLP